MCTICRVVHGKRKLADVIVLIFGLKVHHIKVSEYSLKNQVQALIKHEKHGKQSLLP